MKNHAIYTYCDFLKTAHAFSDVKFPDISNVLASFMPWQHYAYIQSSTFYVIDYVHCSYRLMFSGDKQFLDYTNDYIIEGGPNFILQIYHPDDFNTFNKVIFPANMKALKELPRDDDESLIFSINFRMKNKRGMYQTLNQRSCYIGESKNGMPLAAIGCVTDITPFVQHAKMVHRIDCVKEGGPSRMVLTNSYFPDDGKPSLTLREKEVLRWVLEGYSSKQIAHKLYLSIHTVNNHRKNMLEKTNCKNLSELLNHALRDGIL